MKYDIFFKFYLQMGCHSLQSFISQWNKHNLSNYVILWGQGLLKIWDYIKETWFKAYRILEFMCHFWNQKLGITLQLLEVVTASRGKEHMSRVMGNGALRSVSLSYPKKDWWVGPRQSFFGYDTNYKFVLYCLNRLYSLVGVIPKDGLAGPLPEQSFFWYDNDKDLKACFPMTRLIYIWDVAFEQRLSLKDSSNQQTLCDSMLSDSINVNCSKSSLWPYNSGQPQKK